MGKAEPQLDFYVQTFILRTIAPSPDRNPLGFGVKVELGVRGVSRNALYKMYKFTIL